MAALTRRLASPLRLAFVLAALVGLLAMHGLSDHGSHQATASAAADTHAAHAESDAAGAAANQPSSENAVGPTPSSQAPSRSVDGIVMGLCLAVFFLVGAAAMRNLRRGWPVAARLVARWRSVVLVAGSTPRRLHPPPYSLQVMRC